MRFLDILKKFLEDECKIVCSFSNRTCHYVSDFLIDEDRIEAIDVFEYKRMRIKSDYNFYSVRYHKTKKQIITFDHLPVYSEIDCKHAINFDSYYLLTLMLDEGFISKSDIDAYYPRSMYSDRSYIYEMLVKMLHKDCKETYYAYTLFYNDETNEYKLYPTRDKGLVNKLKHHREIKDYLLTDYERNKAFYN